MKYSTKVLRSTRQMRDSDQPLCIELQELILRARELVNDRILRLPQTSEKLGQANSTTWKYVKDGILPPPIRLGPRSVGWLESEINAVIAAKVFASRSQQPIDMKVFVSLLIACQKQGGLK